MRVCDHPAATRPLRNRAEMLAGLEGGGWRFEVGGLAAFWALAAAPAQTVSLRRGCFRRRQEQQQGAATAPPPPPRSAARAG